MGFLDRLLGKSQPQAPEPVAAPASDMRGLPGTRIHHEYFVADEPENGRYPWLCRVYDADSALHQMTGSDETNQAAAQAAIAWAESKKAELRRGA